MTTTTPRKTERTAEHRLQVATSLHSFTIYQETEAWTWEHLALTRARVVVGGADLAQSVEQFRRALIVEKGRGARVLPDVAAMRARLLAAWVTPPRPAPPAASPWSIRRWAKGERREGQTSKRTGSG